MPSFEVLTATVLLAPFLLFPHSSVAETTATTRFSHSWSNSSKQSVGTAFGRKSSKVWFTAGHGILNEVYYPRIDRAQIGDSQLLFTIGNSFLEEKRDFDFDVAHPPVVPRIKLKAVSKAGITFTKEILSDPDRPVVRVRYRFDSLPENTSIFILHKPAADNDGAHDRGRTFVKKQGAVAFIGWDEESTDRAYQTVISSASVLKSSVGVVGDTDGWQDLKNNGRMTYEIQQNAGNLAYTAQLKPSNEIEVLIGFGSTPEESLNAAINSLHSPFNDVRDRYDAGWKDYSAKLERAPWLAKLPSDARDALLWDAAVVKAHEDKLNPGAIVASLSIPNLPAGHGAGDGKNTGGYHLVWPRDLFKSALSLLRLGDAGTALNALRFMTRMERNGKIAQNTWVDGRPFWTGEQMDEEAFPVLLASELKNAGTDISEFSDFLNRRLDRIRSSGGRTGQERWEEAGGYSPNTMAVMAAALSRAGDDEGARRMLALALSKTVSRHGPLSRDPYFIRISTTGDPDDGHLLQIANGGPLVPEFRVLDGGFLEWVRWFPKAGLELASSLKNSLQLYDDPANGVALRFNGIPLYRRYYGDAYGVNHIGGPWPLLSLERALPELAADPSAGLHYMSAIRKFYGAGDMCPEQLGSDSKPMPYAASPLVWCHAEMVELAYRSVMAKLNAENR